MPQGTPKPPVNTTPADEFDYDVKLNSRGWYTHRKRLGLNTDAEVAAAMGVAPNAVWRVQTGKTAGPKFIAAALYTFRAARFEELFEPVRVRKAAA